MGGAAFVLVSACVEIEFRAPHAIDATSPFDSHTIERKYAARRLGAAPQVVRRLRRPCDREHFLSCRPLVVGHGGDQWIVGRAAEDDVAPAIVAARFRVLDRRYDRFPGERVQPRPRVIQPVLHNAELRFDEAEL